MCESKNWKYVVFLTYYEKGENSYTISKIYYLFQDPWVKGHNKDIKNDPKENCCGTLNTKQTRDKEYSHKKYSCKKRQVSFVFSHCILWI